MKYLLLFFLLIAYSICTFSQKRPIDTSVLDKWPYVINPDISNDGNYASYRIVNQPVGSHTLVIQGTNSSWEKQFIGVSSGFFSGDNKKNIFQRGDTICFLQLGSQQANYVPNTGSYKWPQFGKGEWLAYQLKNSANDLVLLNLFTGKEERFAHVTAYSFDNSGNVLIIKTESKQDSIAKIALKWISLQEGKVTTIWSTQSFPSKSSTVSNYSFDTEGNQLAFIVKEEKDAQFTNSIWYYKAGMNKAEIRANNQSLGIDSALSIDGPPEFSKNGRWIFFQLQQSLDNQKPGPDAVKVDIWSYKDVVLQPDQILRLRQRKKTFTAVVNAEGSQVVRIEHDDEEVKTSPRQISGDFVVIADQKRTEYWWNLSPQPSFYLLSLKDGSRKSLKKANRSLNNFSFSPQGRYLVYYDYEQTNYFSFDIMTGKVRNITRTIPARIITENIKVAISLAVAPVANWLERDSAVLIYDNYDIWKVDPSGDRLPVNVTNGYGLKNHVKLRLVYEKDALNNDIIYSRDESVLLTGFNTLNKYNGFYRKLLDEKGNPQLLIMGPYTFYHTDSQIGGYYEFDEGMKPLKASDANSWIVKRQTANQAPNYFFTRDFKNYTILSNLQPQADFNWLTTELVNWKQLDGTPSQGILYKPENFDPHRKYPVIFNYYEKLSHRLYEFPEPKFTGTNIDIPWFVSNGYLVFTPDIHYSVANKSGKPVGEWAYNSVVSAAQHLSQMPYVDAKKMAIQGHSFGGLETNYLVTHTHLFAAAAEVAGSSDPISAYLTLVPFPDGGFIENASPQSGIETSHQLYGATPWQRPDLYLKNSAVLSADRVTAPLLIMHNMKDEQIQWRQGVELYMALRRMGKKVWMLQYDEGGHGVWGKDAVDYTIRLTQFFDYYLKGAPPPKWMMVGVPARLKGVEAGYELDLRPGAKP